MTDQETIIALDSLLLITAIAFLFILLINNFVFYRRKIKDEISLMIIFCFVTAFLEVAWALAAATPDLVWVVCIIAVGYTSSLVIFSSIFLSFFLRFFGYYPKRAWPIILFMAVPNIVIFVLSATSPWTGLIFYVTEAGTLAGGVLYPLFIALVMSYFFASFVVAIVYLIKNKNKNKVTKKVAFMLIGFDAIIPAFLLVQGFILGFESPYTVMSLTLAMAMTFLISNLNSHLLVETESKMKTIEAELEIASKIQTNALPAEKPNFSGKYPLELRAFMKTAKNVGGDFYDYFPIDDKRFCFLIADVSGKGTPAALFMMDAKTVVKDHAIIYQDTAKILSLANNRLCEGNKATMFATAWIAIIDFENMTMQYTNAGHNFPILHQKSGIQCLKKVDGTVLGIMKNIPYRSNTIKIESGDRIILYTDGVTEAHASGQDLFGDDRLIKLFTDNLSNSEDETVNAIYNDITAYTHGADQFDDITMMVLTIK